MSVELGVTFDVRRFVRVWDEAVVKQIPFATALALTTTAKEAQRSVIDRLPENFTIRTGWVPGGIRIKPAKKNDLTTSVGSRSDFMIQQTMGGDRIAKSGRLLAIPLTPARPNITDVTPRKKWPRALARKRSDRHWVMRWGPIAALVHRTGPQTIEPVYLLSRTVKIKPRWPLREQVQAVFDRRLGPNFVAALERAMATRRR